MLKWGLPECKIQLKCQNNSDSCFFRAKNYNWPTIYIHPLLFRNGILAWLARTILTPDRGTCVRTVQRLQRQRELFSSHGWQEVGICLSQTCHFCKSMYGLCLRHTDGRQGFFHRANSVKLVLYKLHRSAVIRVTRLHSRWMQQKAVLVFNIFTYFVQWPSFLPAKSHSLFQENYLFTCNCME